MTQIEGF